MTLVHDIDTRGTVGKDVGGRVNHVDRIILFDGVCNLCNTAVQFILKRDPKAKFHFTALQSTDGDLLLKRYVGRPASPLTYGTLVLVEGSRVYFKSTAALRIARALTFPWPLCYGFIALPRTLRNSIYDFVAKHRYRWFGKRDVCRRPTSSERQRFQIWK